MGQVDGDNGHTHAIDREREGKLPDLRTGYLLYYCAQRKRSSRLPPWRIRMCIGVLDRQSLRHRRGVEIGIGGHHDQRRHLQTDFE